MKNKLVSVIMSTYNENEIHLRQAIDSIITQKYNNLEIIIVIDNPENKELVKILNQYKETDKRITIIMNNKNIGLVASLNKALSVCKGEYIARMDADDISLPNRILNQVEYLEIHKNIDLIGCDLTLIDNLGNKINSNRKLIKGYENIKKNLILKQCVAHPSWVFRKRILVDYQLWGYREVKYCEDYDFLFRLVLKGGTIENLDTKLLKYRIRTNGVCQSNAYSQLVMVNKISKSYYQATKTKRYNYESNTSYLLNTIIPIDSNNFRYYKYILKVQSESQNWLLRTFCRVLVIPIQLMDKELKYNLIKRFKMRIFLLKDMRG
ncbi:glycosyltransferase [Sutcliffiella horikoshii]|uniref:glycosyltransferase n=1 Tax=Sutcliffiella horikoshii TaxID=79883 RepID=UPI001CBACED2|nr:glycosyltransferase [Sutcliffiella horikoshii]UAL46932.1 glycosyltransferase [Sutcliffiella horikoshii]